MGPIAAHRRSGPAATAVSTSATVATPSLTRWMASRHSAAYSRLATCPGTSRLTSIVTFPTDS